MKRLTLLITQIFIMGSLVGCQHDSTVVSQSVPVPSTSEPEKNLTTGENSQAQDSASESGVSKFLGRANELLEQQAESGSEGAKKAQQWMTDKLGQATDSGSEIAGDTSQWATDTYESLKEKGLTSAGSASQWLTEDIKNMNAFQYKVVKISLSDLGAVEEQLNKLGKLRWDCFHAVEQNGETILFFKKGRQSILKNIPVKDMLKLIPLMSDGGE